MPANEQRVSDAIQRIEQARRYTLPDDNGFLRVLDCDLQTLVTALTDAAPRTGGGWAAHVEGYKAGATCFIGDEDQLDEAAEWSAQNAGHHPDTAPAGVRELVAALDRARDWIGGAPHGDNCYLTNEYPGDSCICGKESLVEYLTDAIAALPDGREDGVPVAWLYTDNSGRSEVTLSQWDARFVAPAGVTETPLYAAPPVAQERGQVDVLVAALRRMAAEAVHTDSDEHGTSTLIPGECSGFVYDYLTDAADRLEGKR